MRLQPQAQHAVRPMLRLGDVDFSARDGESRRPRFLRQCCCRMVGAAPRSAIDSHDDDQRCGARQPTLTSP